LPAFATVAILVSGAPMLSARGMQWLGRLSYTWYLWHWPVLIFATVLIPNLGLAGRIVAAVCALLISQVLHVLVENPVRYHPRLVAEKRRSLALGLWLTSGAALVSVGFYGYAAFVTQTPEQRRFTAAAAERRPPDERCWSALQAKSFMECVRGNPQSLRTVVLYGDSHAEQWLPVIDDIAKRNNVRIVTFLRGACPVADVHLLPGADPRYRECVRWRAKVLTRIAEIKPDAVILGSYQASYSNEAFSDQANRAAVWKRAYQSLFESLRASATQIVILRDTPRPHTNIPNCLSRSQHSPLFRRASCNVPRSFALDSRVPEVERAAAGDLDVRVIDLTAYFCGQTHCPAVVGDLVVYRDASHITTQFAKTLTTQVERQLLHILAQGAAANRS
jgi:hypothetical protein